MSIRLNALCKQIQETCDMALYRAVTTTCTAESLHEMSRDIMTMRKQAIDLWIQLEDVDMHDTMLMLECHTTLICRVLDMAAKT